MLPWYLWQGRASLRPSPAYFSLSIGTNLQINITLSLAKATKKDTKNAPHLFYCLFATSLQNLITTFADMKKCSAPQFWRVWCIIILTLVVAMLPHHHHGEAVCMAWSHCDTAEHSVPSHGESITHHCTSTPHRRTTATKTTAWFRACARSSPLARGLSLPMRPHGCRSFCRCNAWKCRNARH